MVRPLRCLIPSLLGLAGAVQAQPVLYVLASNNQIARISEGSPGTAAGALVPVTGLVAGEVLVAIDTRPQNGRLYGLGYHAANDTVRVYHLTYGTPNAIATALGNAAAFDVPVAGADFGMDFNPAVDRIRVVTSAGQNFRLNPNTGAAIDNDGNAGNGVQMDGAINGAAGIVATAYANNRPNTPLTSQLTLSSTTDSIYLQNPPNNGTQTAPVAITLGGNPLDFTADAALDLPSSATAAVANGPVSGVGLAMFNVGGVSGLYRLRLDTGEATLVGSFGALAVRDIALGHEFGAAQVLDAVGPSLVRFRMEQPGTTTTVAFNGIAAGEVLVGIDGRPATGQLFALGINGATDTGTLYLADPQTGGLTAIGAAGAIALANDVGGAIDLSSTRWAFDFNPTVDRIRVANDTGLNFRVNPLTGLPVDANTMIAGNQPDGGVNGAAGPYAIVGAAYANDTVLAAVNNVTTLYTLDATGNRLSIQNPPNNGTQSGSRTVTLGGFTLDFGDAGFDIPPGVDAPTSNAEAPGTGYATLTVGGAALLYGIDLPSGAVSQFFGPIGAGSGTLQGLVTWNAPVYRVFANGFEE